MRIEDDIRDAFTSLAAEVKRSRGWADVETRIHRAHRRRSLLTVVGSVVLVSIFAVVLPRLTSGSVEIGPIAPESAWKKYRHDGWGLEYPSSWRAQRFLHMFRVEHDGVLVTNFEHRFEREASSSAWDFSGRPDNAVIIQFARNEGGPMHQGPTPLPDTPRPYAIDELKEEPYRYGLVAVFKAVTLHGYAHYQVIVWFGPDASDADREIARRIVASIAP